MLLGPMAGAEVHRRRVEGEHPRDPFLAAHLVADLRPPLGPGRALRGYLEEAFGAEGVQEARREDVDGGEVGGKRCEKGISGRAEMRCKGSGRQAE